MADGLRATATWQGAYAVEAGARRHRVRVDEPAEVGGEDSGMMPTELLCASLASCFCLAVAHVAAKRDRELPGLEVGVDAERLGRAPRYGRLRVTVDARAPQEELEALVERARPFCWVSNMLATDIEVHYVARGAARA